jgi:hypothetical protein
MRDYKTDVHADRGQVDDALTDVLHEGVRLIALPMRVWIDPFAHEILVLFVGDRSGGGQIGTVRWVQVWQKGGLIGWIDLARMVVLTMGVLFWVESWIVPGGTTDIGDETIEESRLT